MDEKLRILLCEDDENLGMLLREYLQAKGYAAELYPDGEAGYKAFLKNKYDLCVFDVMMPKKDGFTLAQEVRAANAEIPIIFLTAKTLKEDILEGFKIGADDYITKPFSPKILVSRIKAVLRRKNREEADNQTVLKVNDLVIHPGRHEVLLSGEPLELTYTEFKILHFLAGRPGWVFTRYQIVDAVRGEEYPVTERAVDVQIVGLRKKLGSYGDLIETVRGVGYRFKE